MSGPHVSLDPASGRAGDMLDVTWTRIERQIEAEEAAFRAGESMGKAIRRVELIALAGVTLVLGILIGALAVAGTVHASAPRGASVIPAAPLDLAGTEPDQTLPGAPRSGMAVDAAAEATREAPAPVGEVGAPPPNDPQPTPKVGVTEPDAVAGGIIAYADPSHGDRYLALPEGPGVRVTICSGINGLCLQRISTDAGPALFRQAEGRIADVSFVDFAWLCRCDPPSRGTMPATIEYHAGPGATPPPTDVEP